MCEKTFSTYFVPQPVENTTYAKNSSLEYWGLFQGRLYFTSSEKLVFVKHMSVSSILLGYRLKRRKRRKRVVLKNRCEIFRDNNHQSVNKNIKLCDDIDWNPEPVYMNKSIEYCYLQVFLRIFALIVFCTSLLRMQIHMPCHV